jgi:hypothetical protein
MARHPTSRRLLTARRGHDLALGLDGPEPASAHPPVARRAVSPFDRSRAIRARRNYAGTSPITKASGTRRVVLARFARNERLFDACYLWAFSTLTKSPGARCYYDRQRARGKTHSQALRAIGNRLVGILHGCLRRGEVYQEDVAWPSRESLAA